MPDLELPGLQILLLGEREAETDLVFKTLELTRLPMEIQVVNCLKEGLRALRKQAFNVILLDLNLSDSQGIETLKSMMVEVKEAVVIVLADVDDEECSLKSLQLGAQDYLLKDRLSGEDLRQSIRYAIERSNLLRKPQNHIQRTEDKLFQAEKLNSISLLAGGIAHDFNNMLATILGNISMIRIEMDEGHSYSEKLLAAEKAALQAKSLTQQLLTLSRGGTPVLEVTTVAEVVEECAQFVLRGSNVKCEVSKDEDLWPVDADKGQISQVVNNLIINADQAMPRGGKIAISIGNSKISPSEVPSLDSGNYVCIEFKDEGDGIPPENLKRIFDPYFTTKKAGNGLGLASSYSIVQSHKGSIIAESTLGSGSVFKVYLPKSQRSVEPVNTTEIKQAKESSKETIHRGKGRILVMDDMEAMMLVAGEILTVLGYEVEYTTNGEEAIAAYQKAKESGNGFDAVVFDLTVPGGMGGEEAANILIEYDPDLIAIASSGYTTSNVMSAPQDSAFKGVVPKPYRIKEMGDALHKVLS
ncbi:MAG: response regulator [Opitutales bacterium]